MVFSSLRSFRL